MDAGHGHIESRLVEVSDPARQGHAVRAYWSVESNLHWVLDISFDEDRNRVRKGHSAANLAIMCQVTLNLIKSEKISKLSVPKQAETTIICLVLGVI